MLKLLLMMMVTIMMMTRCVGCSSDPFLPFASSFVSTPRTPSYGPPGCAKTTLAAAMAASTNSAFISADAAEIYSPLLGEAERQLRALFALARANQPCVLFLDEIDGLVANRDQSSSSSGVEERVLSTLLNEMDGVSTAGDVLLVAATNRPEVLDPALKRPGRLDRQFYVPPPDLKAIRTILSIHTRKMPLDTNVSLEELATGLQGYTGADIENVCREASMSALRRDISRCIVMQEDFQMAANARRPSVSKEELQAHERFASC